MASTNLVEHFLANALGGQTGEAPRVKLLVLAIVAAALYYATFNAVTYSLKLFGRKPGLGVLATAIPWIPVVPAMAWVYAYVKPPENLPLLWFMGGCLLVCVGLVFVPVQRLLMKGTYARHLLATTFSIVLVAFVINWVSSILTVIKWTEESGKYNKIQVQNRDR